MIEEISSGSSATVIGVPAWGFATVETSSVVETIEDLRAIPGASGVRAFVLGYYKSGDGGGGFYDCVIPSGAAENGGSVIVGLDGSRWILSNDGVPNILKFGCQSSDPSYVRAAINDALASEKVVAFPGGRTYAVDGPIIVRDETSILGIGSHGNGFTAAATNSPKFIFTGSGDACFLSDDTSNLRYPQLSNFCVYVAPTATYNWLFDLTETIGANISDIRAESASLTTGGFRSRKRASGAGPSWVNHITNMQIKLPGYTGSGSPPVTTMPSLDVDFSDSQVMGGSFTGGTGAIVRGSGVVAFSNVRIDQSSGYNLKLIYDTPDSAAAHRFSNCLFEQCYGGEVLIDLDGSDTTTPRVLPSFIGNLFWSPGRSSPIIRVKNDSGPAATVGGVFIGNSFTANPAQVYDFANDGKGWTIASNTYQNAPDYTGASGAYISEATNVRGVSILSQGGTTAAHTGDTSEVAFAQADLKANTLKTNEKLRISATFAVSSSIYAKTPRIRVGNGLTGQAFYVGTLSGTSQLLVNVICEVVANGANNSQVTATAQTATGNGIVSGSSVTGTVNMAFDHTITITGQLGNASDSITLVQHTIELLRP